MKVEARRRARRGEGDLLREQIIAATERLLVKTGDEEAVSIRAVAESVGVTPPSIYLHFRDKDELIFAICERHFARLDEFIEIEGSKSDDPVESLILRGKAYVRFGIENPEPYRILFMSKGARSEENMNPEELRQSASFDHLVQAVQRCIDAGAFDGDPLLLSMGLWAAVHGITSILISHPHFPWPDQEKLIDHVLRVQCAGLGASVGGGASPRRAGPPARSRRR
jgi:AcrR family transcriptional regulator